MYIAKEPKSTNNSKETKELFASPGAQALAMALSAMVSKSLKSRCFEDAESMRVAAQKLWPECPFVEALEGIILGSAGFYTDALLLVSDRNDTPSLSVRAYCLLKLDDPSWEGLSHEILTRNDCARSSNLMRDLLASIQSSAFNFQ